VKLGGVCFRLEQPDKKTEVNEADRAPPVKRAVYLSISRLFIGAGLNVAVDNGYHSQESGLFVCAKYINTEPVKPIY